jgi:hypothetical protein
MAETVDYPLEQPITAHNEEVTVLQVRRPTIQEIRAIKVLPYVLNEDSFPIFDTEAVCKYLAVCCAIPAGSVNQLALADLNKLCWVLASFFMPTSSEPPTN